MRQPIDCECDIGWRDRLWAFLIAAAFLAFFIALFTSAKKETIVNDIVEIDIDDIILDESLPEIVFDEAILPEILPPLYKEPLPPLQGEV